MLAGLTFGGGRGGCGEEPGTAGTAGAGELEGAPLEGAVTVDGALAEALGAVSAVADVAVEGDVDGAYGIAVAAVGWPPRARTPRTIASVRIAPPSTAMSAMSP